MLGRGSYSEYCGEFRRVWRYLCSCSRPAGRVYSEICSIRGYEVSRMRPMLERVGFCFIEDASCFDALRDVSEKLGLFGKDGGFLLSGRYIFPVRDMLGNVISLIGWYPDEKKYITTPSRLFSKGGMFFGMEQLGSTGVGKPYVLVEGIFDSLSVRSLGFNCVAQMGISSSRYKEVLYSLFGSILAIPDNDTQGLGVIREDKWNLPLGGKYMRWKTSGYYLKDIDDFCNSYSEEDMTDLIKDVWKQKDRVVVVEV